MKHAIFILLAFLGGGCVAAHPMAEKAPAPTAHAAPAVARAQPAEALCFASEVTSPMPLPGLDRADREPSAFLGYDQEQTETYFIFTDDEQLDLVGNDLYQRDAVYARSGVRTR